jgi:hypothetical protein
VDAQAPSGTASDSVALPPGTYVFTLVADSSDDIKKAVNATVEHMSFITRPVARGRLNKTNPLPKQVQVTISHDTLSAKFDDGNPVVTPISGDTVPYLSAVTHETYKATYSPVGDTLSQAIIDKDGVRRNTYIFFDGGQRLRMHVTVTSPRLPGPLNYQLLFTKAPS